MRVTNDKCIKIKAGKDVPTDINEKIQLREIIQNSPYHLRYWSEGENRPNFFIILYEVYDIKKAPYIIENLFYYFLGIMTEKNNFPEMYKQFVTTDDKITIIL